MPILPYPVKNAIARIQSGLFQYALPTERKKLQAVILLEAAGIVLGDPAPPAGLSR